MYEKEDYKHYIDQMIAMEAQMENNILELITQVDDEAVRRFLNMILQDEQRHQKLLDEVEVIINSPE